MTQNCAMENPPQTRARNSLLAIDDEIEIGKIIVKIAEGLGFSAFATADVETFYRYEAEHAPAVIVVDLMMPDADGIELLRFLAERKCRSGIIVASGMDTRVLSTALRLGEEHGLRMLGSLQKPMQIEALEALLRTTMSQAWHPTVAELEYAIFSGQLEVFYQPKISLQDGRVGVITECEALVRWRHPEKGLVGPDEFIALAEDSGLVESLTYTVLEQVAAQIARWDEIGLPMGVAVNLAASSLDKLDLPDRIAEILRHRAVPPERLTLEVTESTAMASATRSMDTLTRLRVKGLGLSIDDFGTGYSSFVQLYRMPFNELKIDKSFTLDVCGSAEAATIVRSITDLAHNLGLTVCAEGVETAEVLDFILNAGCEKVQGYYFQRPAAADDFAGFTLDWNSRESGERPVTRLIS